MLRKALFQVVTLTTIVVLLALPTSASADGPCTIDTLASGGGGASLGDASNNEIGQGQTFLAPCSGEINAFQVRFNANSGSPTGDVTWEIAADYLGQPGAIVTSGTFTPVPSTINTINVAGGAYLSAGSNYWLTLEAVDQATNVGFILYRATSSTYANGASYSNSNDGLYGTPVNDLFFVMTLNALGPTATTGPTSTPADTATPTPTLTPTATNTPDYFIVATFSALPDYPIAVKPTATMGEMSVSGLLIALIVVLVLFGGIWLLRQR